MTKSKRVSRRKVLAGAAAALGSTVFSPKTGAQEATAPADPTKIQGRLASELGTRSPHETIHRIPYRSTRTSSHTPLQDLDGIITPSDLHFERHHGGIPEIDPDSYSLLIHGMVDQPKIYTLAELKRFPPRSMIRFLECSGNGGRSYRPPEDEQREMTPQQADGLTSTSEWTGVPLATLFEEVGVKPEATWFLAEAMDAAIMTRSIPVSKAWDDAIIAYRQNGEALRPEQGYPARLFLPGFEGSSNVKWIRRIELSDQPFMSREETAKYTDPLPDGTARSFSFVMDAKSLITFPAHPVQLSERGWWTITGIAWTGRGKIVRVDVSTDGGASWHEAELEEPVLAKCHTRFRLPWNWDGNESVIMSRATDETGYTQPSLDELMDVRGPGTRYHYNHVRAWTVREDGTVLFGIDPPARAV
jgi:sulfane dehydrogenase subunit SoxC